MTKMNSGWLENLDAGIMAAQAELDATTGDGGSDE